MIYPQPHHASPGPPRPQRAARRPCGCFPAALLIFFAPIFVCGLSLVAYLLLPPPSLSVMVLGLDARPNEGFMARADTIMLISVQPRVQRVSLLSIPRDLFFEVPGYGYQRINAVHMLGEVEGEGRGPALVAQAIERGFGFSPDRYVRLNFETFVELIDAVGGITVNIERPIVDPLYPTPDGGTTVLRFEAGLQILDGERALAYARTRNADDDYARAGRQQQVLLALSRRLLNPATWPAALSVFSRSLDTDLTLLDAAALPTIALNAGRFERLVIDRSLITANARGQAVPNYAALADWVNERFD
ncbi:MAG: LCP family protein [Aggregatilineales bacterium]